MWVLINWDMWWCIGSSACPVKGESEFEQQNWTLNKIKHWTSSQLISLWFRLLGGHCIMTSLSRVGGSHENVMEVGGLSWNTWIKYICSMNFPICSQTNQSHICCWEKMNTALPMFHLRCALGAPINVFSKNVFALVFLTFHSTFRFIVAKCCTKEILCAHRL